MVCWMSPGADQLAMPLTRAAPVMVLACCVLAACTLNRSPLPDPSGKGDDGSGGDRSGSGGASGSGGSQFAPDPAGTGGETQGTGGMVPSDGAVGDGGTGGAIDDTGGTGGDAGPVMRDYETENPLNVPVGSTQGSCPDGFRCTNSMSLGFICSELDGSVRVCSPMASGECTIYGPNAPCVITPNFFKAYCLEDCTQ